MGMEIWCTLKVILADVVAVQNVVTVRVVVVVMAYAIIPPSLLWIGRRWFLYAIINCNAKIIIMHSPTRAFDAKRHALKMHE